MPNTAFKVQRLSNCSTARILYKNTQKCSEFLKLSFIRTGFTIASIVPSNLSTSLRNDKHALIVHPFPRDSVEYQIDNDLKQLLQAPIYWERGTCSGKPMDALFFYFIQEVTMFQPPMFTRRDGSQLDWYKLPIDMCSLCNFPLFKNHICQHETSTLRQYRGLIGPIMQRQQQGNMNKQIHLDKDEYENPIYTYQLQVEASFPPGLLRNYKRTQQDNI